MKSFRTEVLPEISSRKISAESNLFFIGSCFAENIGNKLIDRKFNLCMNPSGIIYNPISISNCLNNLLLNRHYSQSDLISKNNMWFSLEHHSRFNDISAEKCLWKINSEIVAASEMLLKSDFIFVTLGTAIVYHHIKVDKIVANCHKLPSNDFKRKFLTVDEIVQSFEKTLMLLHKKNPNAKLIFTISPVRHWSEGAEDNQLSKSILFVAIQKLIEKSDKYTYFPAYELLIDDLRDYRFYKSDMLHPNEQAIDYIWTKFREKYFDATAKELCDEIEVLISASNHKPFWPESEEHRRFLRKNSAFVKKVKEKFPFADMSDFEKNFE